MNLANLLAMGQSFFKGHGTPAYREHGRRYVPQFNNGKNPFTPKVTPVAAPVAAAQKPLARSPRPARAASWVEKMNPFRAPVPVKALGRVEQPELSLSSVKVLRNDLAATDIARVPAKSRTLPPPPVKSEVGAWEVLANAS
jgi:hypothetical protein